MTNPVEVRWTERSLRNARAIKKYLFTRFTKKEVLQFESLLKEFEITVSHFPTLYPESEEKPKLRRAVIHKGTTVYYMYSDNLVTVIAMKDNRQQQPSK